MLHGRGAFLVLFHETLHHLVRGDGGQSRIGLRPGCRRVCPNPEREGPQAQTGAYPTAQCTVLGRFTLLDRFTLPAGHMHWISPAVITVDVGPRSLGGFLPEKTTSCGHIGGSVIVRPHLVCPSRMQSDC